MDVVDDDNGCKDETVVRIGEDNDIGNDDDDDDGDDGFDGDGGDDDDDDGDSRVQVSASSAPRPPLFTLFPPPLLPPHLS